MKKFLTSISQKKKIIIFSTIVILVYVIFGFTSAYRIRLKNEENYIEAYNFFCEEDYLSAAQKYRELGSYKEARLYARYADALLLYTSEKYEAAIKIFEEIEPFEKSEEYIERGNDALACIKENEESYILAQKYFADKSYKEAYQLFYKLKDYKDSEIMAEHCKILFERHHLAETISAGIQMSSCVLDDGHVLITDKNFADSHLVNSWSDMLSISASNEFLIGLKEDGSAVLAKRKNYYKYRVDVSEWKDMIQVSAGEQYVVGLRSDGTLTAQGINGYGEIDIDEWRDIAQITTSWQCTAGLDHSGNIHIAGYNSENLLKEIESDKSDWINITAISLGGSTSKDGTGRGHIVALKKDGTVVAAGDNVYGQCDVDKWTDIIAISAGDYHTVGLKSDGTVVTTQRGSKFSQSVDMIKDWRNITAISAGYGFTLGLHRDGTVSAVGLENEGQCDVHHWNNVRQGAL